MDARRFLLMISLLVSVSAAGCMVPDPSVDLLEGELRWMEDQLYMLEDELQQKCDELSECRQRGDCNTDVGSGYLSSPGAPALRPQPRDDSGTDGLLPSPREPSPAERRRNTPDDGEDSVEELPDGVSADRDEFEPSDEDEIIEPEIEMPAPVPLRGDIPELDDTFDAPEPGDTTHLAPSGEELVLAPDADDQHVTHLVLNTRRNSQVEFMGDDREDLRLVIEPRNRRGDVVEISAPVSVVVLDSGRQGTAARLGRWDFDAVETGRTLETSKLGRGIHLSLNWPDENTVKGDLQVFVRYTTLDGREIEANQILRNGSTGPEMAGWTPAVKPIEVHGNKTENRLVTELTPFADEQGRRRATAIQTQPIDAAAIPPTHGQAHPDAPGASETPRRPAVPQILEATNDRPTWQPYR